MQKPIAGVAFLRADGQQFALRGELTVSLASLEREGIAGQDGVHGFKETPRVPFIQGNISDSDGLDIDAIGEITDATVQVELANGKTGILRNAWVATAIELDAAEGQMQVRFEGKSGEWNAAP